MSLKNKENFLSLKNPLVKKILSIKKYLCFLTLKTTILIHKSDRKITIIKIPSKYRIKIDQHIRLCLLKNQR